MTPSVQRTVLRKLYEMALRFRLPAQLAESGVGQQKLRRSHAALFPANNFVADQFANRVGRRQGNGYAPLLLAAVDPPIAQVPGA